jgi:hypothetical protein
MTEQSGPSVGELEEAFPMVDRDKLAHIREQIPNLTYRTAADVLDEAAQQSKVPNENYRQLAAVADGTDSLELDPSDPLDDPPDPDPTSPHNQQRGDQAMGHLKSTDYKGTAEAAIENGTIADMVEILTNLDKWANEALLQPNRATLPAQAKEPMQMLGDAIIGRIDALAARGQQSDLQAVKEDIALMHNEAFRSRLEDAIDQKLRLLNNSGDDYEDARQRVLAETNTPQEVQDLYQDTLENADITYQQAVELGADVRDWLEEYREVAEQAQEA